MDRGFRAPALAPDEVTRLGDVGEAIAEAFEDVGAEGAAAPASDTEGGAAVTLAHRPRAPSK